jgi:hypothetical protein
MSMRACACRVERHRGGGGGGGEYGEVRRHIAVAGQMDERASTGRVLWGVVSVLWEAVSVLLGSGERTGEAALTSSFPCASWS